MFGTLQGVIGIQRTEVCIGAEHLVDGDRERTLAALWALITHFVVRSAVKRNSAHQTM